MLARTATVERAVVRVEGPGAGLAEILSPEEADEAAGSGEAGGRRSFDPAVLEADRRWRAEFARRVRFDDPAQAVGRSGYGRVFLELPAPWAWMTAYSARSANRAGNTLVLKGDADRGVFAALEAERGGIEAELTAAGHGCDIAWRRRGDLCWVEAARTFAGGWWTAEQEPEQLEWLLGASNAFVNAFRPRVPRLLSQGTAA